VMNGRSLKTEYPFIKHIPIAFVMSISHVSGCAMTRPKRRAKNFRL
jgi:hypothetical protein